MRATIHVELLDRRDDLWRNRRLVQRKENGFSGDSLLNVCLLDWRDLYFYHGRLWFLFLGATREQSRKK
jgi:hypothetical protein